MLAVARRAVAEEALQNVTILEGAAEQLPISDSTVDVAVVNGLFNLTLDKQAVARELARVIRDGGRIVGAEIVVTDDRPPQPFDRDASFR